MKLKICGMKHNTPEVAKLQPDYLGFIFYDKSPRNFEDIIPELPKGIKKAGVFVDADIEVILNNIKTYNLDAVQLHGNESMEFCKELRKYCHAERESVSHQEIPASAGMTEIIKVFSIKDEFDFSQLQPFEDCVDYFLFDTKGKQAGGNGYTFNWSVLKGYPSTKPYFLSGGIGLDEIDKVKSFLEGPESEYCYALDVNSKFEIEPGLKDIGKLEVFINELK